MILRTEEHEYEKVISFFIYHNFKIHCFFNKIQGIHNKQVTNSVSFRLLILTLQLVNILTRFYNLNQICRYSWKPDTCLINYKKCFKL